MWVYITVLCAQTIPIFSAYIYSFCAIYINFSFTCPLSFYDQVYIIMIVARGLYLAAYCSLCVSVPVNYWVTKNVHGFLIVVLWFESVLFGYSLSVKVHFLQMSLHKHACIFPLFFVAVCKCIVYQQVCFEFHTTLSQFQVWCTSVFLLFLFLSHMNMSILSFSCGTKNTGMLYCCTKFHVSMLVSYLNMHLPLFIDAHTSALFTNNNNVVSKNVVYVITIGPTLVPYVLCVSCANWWAVWVSRTVFHYFPPSLPPSLPPSVAAEQCSEWCTGQAALWEGSLCPLRQCQEGMDLPVPYVELHEHTYPYCSCCGMRMYCLPTFKLWESYC